MRIREGNDSTAYMYSDIGSLNTPENWQVVYTICSESFESCANLIIYYRLRRDNKGLDQLPVSRNTDTNWALVNIGVPRALVFYAI